MTERAETLDTYFADEDGWVTVPPGTKVEIVARDVPNVGQCLVKTVDKIKGEYWEFEVYTKDLRLSR